MIRSRCSDRLIRRWKMKRPVSLDGERMARNAGRGIADRIGPRATGRAAGDLPEMSNASAGAPKPSLPANVFAWGCF